MAVDLRDEHRQRSRDAIVAAAWELAERRGLVGLSLRELAAEVGLRAPSLYSYFPAKAAIYDAMFVEAHESLDAHMAEVPTDGEPVDALARVLTAWLRFCLASIPRYQLLYTHVIPDWSPSAEAYGVAVRTYERFRTQMAAIGVTEQRHLDLMTALSAGLAAQQVANEPRTERWVGLAEDAARMFVAAVLPTDDDTRRSA